MCICKIGYGNIFFVLIARETQMKTKRKLKAATFGRNTHDSPLFHHIIIPRTHFLLAQRRYSGLKWVRSESQMCTRDGLHIVPPIHHCLEPHFAINGRFNALTIKQNSFASSGIKF